MPSTTTTTTITTTKFKATPRPLKLDKPPTIRRASSSSADSSLDTPYSSPTAETIIGLPDFGSIRGGILTSNPPSAPSTPGASTTNLNVKFAPLPELAPRRRKSSTPLGVASRGQMVRRRKQSLEPVRQPYELDDEPPVLSPPPPSKPKARRTRSENNTPSSTPPDAHSFKKFWKKMALSNSNRDTPISTSPPTVVATALGNTFQRSSSSSSSLDRRVGGAWEDEINPDFAHVPPPIIAEHVELQNLKWIEKAEKEQEQLQECLSSNSTFSSTSDGGDDQPLTFVAKIKTDNT